MFKVERVFTLTGKPNVYISGRVVTGRIAAGDFVRLKWNSSMGLEAEVSSVDFIDSECSSAICIGIKCESIDEKTMWLGMSLQEGEILGVIKTK